jgi:hypothetical protein
MLTHWEEFNTSNALNRVHLPRVTIRPTGEFRLSRSALDLIGDPSHVALLFDRVNGRIGIRKSDPDAPNAYRLGARFKQPRSGKSFFAKNFLNFHNLRLQTTLAFEAVDRSPEGYLVLDLSRAVECMREKRSSA